MQRSIREVNTSSRWCVLWDLDEDTHYSVQVTHTHTLTQQSFLSYRHFIHQEAAVGSLYHRVN